MTAIQEQLAGEKTYLTALRRDFHRHPELSLQEFRTAARINDPQACQEAAAAAQALREDMKVITDRSLSLCGDNFAEFLLHTPGAYAYLGTGNPALPNTLCSIHNGDFDVDERALLLGTGLYVEYALAVLAGNT